MLNFNDCISLFKYMLPLPVTLLILGELYIAVSLGAVLHIKFYCRI